MTKQNTTQQLGVLLDWNWTAGATFDPKTLRAALNAMGFDGDTLIPDPKPESQLKAHAPRFTKREGKTVTWKTAIKIVTDANSGQKFAKMSLRQLDQLDAKVSYVHRESVVFNLSEGKFEDSLNQDGHSMIALDLIETMNRYLVAYDGNWIRDNVIAKVAKHELKAIKWKGMYFCPEGEGVNNFKDAMSGVEGFNLETPEIPMTGTWNKAITEATVEHCSNELNKLEDQIDGWIASARNVRPDGKESVLNKCSELLKTASMYEACLSVSLEDLQQRIADMKKKAHEVIENKDAEAIKKAAEKQAEKEAKKAARKAKKEADALAELEAMVNGNPEASGQPFEKTVEKVVKADKSGPSRAAKGLLNDLEADDIINTFEALSGESAKGRKLEDIAEALAAIIG